MKNGWKLARWKEGAVSHVGATARAKIWRWDKTEGWCGWNKAGEREVSHEGGKVGRVEIR